MTVLIVDDDRAVRRTYVRMLERYHVLEAESGTAALEVMEQTLPSIAIVDWKMPGLCGGDLLSLMNSRWPHIPLVVITGYSDEEKAVAAVEYAQAYLRKPFATEALLEAVDRILKGAGQGGGRLSSEVHVRGDIAVSRSRCEVRIRGGRRIPLTTTEFSVLHALLARAGEVVAYRELARAVVAREAFTRYEGAEICKHHISTLRRKIEINAARPRYIRTIYRRGYMLVPGGKSKS
ncbi:MAG: response regulator transcription factor [Deltaproteobacteria bacterium]|nr:response regulator transcription factor [Deltaproteobacteria bacterium]